MGEPVNKKAVRRTMGNRPSDSQDVIIRMRIACRMSDKQSQKAGRKNRLSRKEKNHAVCKAYGKLGLKCIDKNKAVISGFPINGKDEMVIQSVILGGYYLHFNTTMCTRLNGSDRDRVMESICRDNENLIFGRMGIDDDGDVHFSSTVYLKHDDDLSMRELKFHIRTGFAMARRMHEDYELTILDSSEPAPARCGGQPCSDHMFG